MSYIDAYYDRATDKIKVVSKEYGKRVFSEFAAPHTAYYELENSEHKSIFGTDLCKIECTSRQKLNEAVNGRQNIFESDTNVIHDILAEHYLNEAEPVLNICFFDIEADFDKVKGYAPPSNPFNKVTAISLHCSWLDSMITLALKPTNLTKSSADTIAEEFSNTFIFESEAELLSQFLDLIEEADVLSGWFSESYDIPYLINRVRKVLGEASIKRFCLKEWNLRPTKKEVTEFGEKTEIFNLHGRIHLDLRWVYEKFTYIRKQSYKLDAICEEELGEQKVEYDTTIDDMYRNDFKKFIEYSRQDVALLVKLDDKHKFMKLVNGLAHNNTVLIPETLGTVKLTDQAIINEAHSKNLRVPDRIHRDDLQPRKYSMLEQSKAVGAYVMLTRLGLHEWGGAFDVKSMYPNILRALNLSPERIIAQIVPHYTNKLVNDCGGLKEAFQDRYSIVEYDMIMNKTDDELDLNIYKQGKLLKTVKRTAAEVYYYVFEEVDGLFTLSANGTICMAGENGIIPSLVGRWYDERIETQRQRDEFDRESDEWGYYDRQQHIRKINVNALYGALLNTGSRFFDIRIGQSITLTGRMISRFMHGKINEIIEGKNDPNGEALIAGDTDSAYFSAYPALKPLFDSGQLECNREFFVKYYDQIAAKVNEALPEFMQRNFNCSFEDGSYIKGSRESVFRRALFSARKKYGLMLIDDDGKAVDNKLKITGLEIKRSDTPKIVQHFLKQLLEAVLKGIGREDALRMVAEFRKRFAEIPSWQKGSPTSIKDVAGYTAKYKKNPNVTLPGNVRPSINWNQMLDDNGDLTSARITNGSKIIVCKLKNNPYKMKSIAYPVEQETLPEWFQELPFDDKAMEKVVVDGKIDNIFKPLGWNLTANVANNADLFE